jgi:hypothetical protein
MIDAATVTPTNMRWKSAVYRGLPATVLLAVESRRSRSALRRAIFLMVPADLNQRNEADFFAMRWSKKTVPMKTSAGQPIDPIAAAVRYLWQTAVSHAWKGPATVEKMSSRTALP